jgi:hypothetical protein
VHSTRVRRAPINSGGGGSGGGDGEATPLELTQETEQEAESGDAETSPLSLTIRPDSQVEAARVEHRLEHRLEHESHILDAPAEPPGQLLFGRLAASNKETRSRRREMPAVDSIARRAGRIVRAPDMAAARQ